MLKDYIYSMYNKVKQSAKNLAIKLDAIRENQDQILAIKNDATKLFKENTELGESINKTLDSVKNFDTSDISSIDDIEGLKKLVKDLKDTQKLAKDSIEKTQAHKKSIENLADKAHKTVEKIDKSEKEKLAKALDELEKEERAKFENIEASDSTVAELNALTENAKRIQAQAEKKIQEHELENKDETAESKPDSKPEAATEECPNKKICKIKKIEVADKANRLLAYSLENSASNKESGKESDPAPKTLFVIVGEKEGHSESITINAEGECKSDTACPKLEFSGGSTNEKGVSALNKIPLKSEKVIPEQSWADFLRKIIVPDMEVLSKPQVYDIKAHQCDVQNKVADLKVIAVPPVGWSGNAKVSYKMKSDEEKAKIAKENEEKGMDAAKALGEWTFGGEVKGYLDKKELSYKPPKEFLKSLQDCMNKITPLFSEIDNQYASVKVQWPNIDLSGNVDLVEHPSSHQLNYKGEINLKAEPLIQIDCDIDIKAIILRILAKHEVFSDYMMEILNKVEKGIGGDNVKFSGKIEILLKTTAEISGDLRWHRGESDGAWQVDSAKSSIGGSLGVELYGAVHIEGRVFFVRAAAGASISGRSADGKEKCKFGIRWAALEGAANPMLEKELYFNGLGIYYTKYAELGTDDTDTGKKAQEVVKRVRSRPNDDDKEENEDTEESENLLEAGSKDFKVLCKLMQEWSSKGEVAELGKDDI